MANTPNLGLRKIDSKSELFNQTLNYEANFDKVDAHAGSVIAQLGEIETKQGLLSSLLTTAKTSIVAAINELFNNKANKAQEAWITPTLINGWTQLSADVGYMKDTLGWVHFKGAVASGAVGSQIFALPSGYRPQNAANRFAVIANNKIGRISVSNTGAVTFDAGENVFVSLDGLTFKVV